MKKLFLIPLIIILVSGLIFGCAQPAPAPAPTPTPAPAPTLTPAPAPTPAPSPTTKPTSTMAAPIKLRWGHSAPPVTVFQTDAFVPWTQMVKERTTAIGKPVEITIFPAEALVKNKDTYDAIITGVIDIGSMWGPGHFKGRMPLGEVMELPFLFPNTTVSSLVSQEIFDTWPEFRNDYREAKVLGFNPPAPYQITARTKHIKTLEDLKGMKVMVRGGRDVDIVKALGATPVTMGQPDAYLALQSGVLDVGLLNWEGVVGFKWFEVTKYRTDAPKGVYSTSLLMSMNWDTWNGLPPDVQKVINDLSGVYLSKLCGQAMDNALSNRIQVIKQYDKKVGNPDFYYMPEDEFQKWVAAAAPVYDMWLKSVEAKGLPGAKLLEDVKRLTEKYSKEYPNPK